MRYYPVCAALLAVVFATNAASDDEASSGGLEAVQSMWQALESQQRDVSRLQKQVASQHQTVNRMLTDRQSVGISLERAESLLFVRGQQSRLVRAQLEKQIKSWEVAAARSPELKRRITAYQRHIDDAHKIYHPASELQSLAASQAKLLRIRSQIQQALQQPLEDLRQSERKLDQAGLKLAELRGQFATAKQEAMNLANQSAPPFLQKVRLLTPRNRVIYAAQWKPAGMPREFQISKLHQLLEAQIQLLAAREHQVDRWGELVRLRNAECQKMIAESEDATWRQFWRIPTAELSSSMKEVTWDAALPDSPAVLLESGDRLLLTATGQAAWSYEDAGSLASYGILPLSTIEKLAALDWLATQRAIEAAARGESSQTTYGDAGLTDLANIWVTAARVPSTVATADLIDGAPEFEVNEAWVTMVKNADERVIAKAGERLPEIELSAEARRTWKDFAQADARRMVALASFKATAALRWVDRQILNMLLDELDRVTSRGPADSLDRFLVREKDDEIQRRRDYVVELTFSRPDVQVSSVSLGGLPVTAQPADAGEPTVWKGGIRFEKAPASGQLAVEAGGLDDPTTAASLDPLGENWLGYEAGADLNHRLRIGRGAQRSFVIVFDPGPDATQAVSAAATVFQERDFQSGDELALYLANESGIVRAAAFTQNHAQVWQAIESAARAESPLPAWAVVTAGRYLFNQGRGEEKTLLLLANQPVEGLEAALVSVAEMRELVEAAQP